MKGFYIYNLVLEVVLLNVVDCRISPEQVYSLLSQRLNLENSLLRNELKELKAVVKEQDEKIAALGLSAPRTPKTAEDSNENHQNLKIQITVMQHAFQSEKQLVRGIQSNVSGLESKLEEEIVTEIKSSTSELESKLQKEIETGIRSSTSELESKFRTQLAAEIKSSTTELETKLEKEYVKLETKLEKEYLDGLIYMYLLKLDRHKVAFSAELSTSTRELAIGSTIVFDEIIFQDGNGYNSANGVFTCPETGVYMFSVVLHSWHVNDEVKTLVAELVVDSEEKPYMSIVSQSQHSQHNDQASNLVILLVNQGQKVWVKTYSVDAAEVFRTFSTFSGALLYN